MTRRVTDIVDEGEALGKVAGVLASVPAGLTTEQLQDAVASFIDAGSNVSVTYDDVAGTLTIAATAGTIAVEDEGVETVASATRLDFAGAGVTVTDTGSGQATVTIPGATASLLGKSSKTSNQAGITTEADVTSLSVSATVAAGRRVRVEAMLRLSVSQSSGSVAATRGLARLYRGATQIGAGSDAGGVTTSAAALQTAGVSLAFDEPGAGTFTYKVTGLAVGAGASLTVEASAVAPCWIAVYDDGPI